MSIPRFFLSLALTAAALTAADLSKARAIAQQLQRIETTRDGVNRPPEQIADLLANLKLEVRKWLASYFEAVPASPDLSKLQTSLHGEIKNFLPASDDSHAFGGIDDIRVSRASEAGDVLTVAVSYSSYCTSDDSVLLFERRGSHWRLVLNYDNTDFEFSLAGDRTLLYAGISPRDQSGRYYALIVRTRSYCPESGSKWNMINYHVLRPSGNPAAPRILLSAKYPFVAEEDARIQIEKDSFTMEFPAGGLNPSEERTHDLKYSVTGNKIARVPAAPNARDFVDEWLTSEWREVAAWSNPYSLDGFRAWVKIREEAKRPSQLMEVQQACMIGDRRDYQITLEDGYGRRWTSLPVFIVQEIAPHLFHISEIRKDPLENCSATDREPPDHILPESLNRLKNLH